MTQLQKAVAKETEEGCLPGGLEKVTCSFCGGQGKDPFGILSWLSTCVVCGGRGRCGYRCLAGAAPTAREPGPSSGSPAPCVMAPALCPNSLDP